MKLKLLLFFLITSFSRFSYALYGAKAISAGQFSSVVSLHLNDPDEPEYDYFCSGVLVAPDKILTTGHCIEVMGTQIYNMWSKFVYWPSLIKVKADGKFQEVKDVLLAPTYTEAMGFEGEDLALIILSRPLNIKPLKIASRASLSAGQSVTLVARGKSADSKILSIKSFGGNFVTFTDGSISGVCSGDSGGALVTKINNEYMLAGILSAQSEGCKKQTSASIFPRILR
jgi:secreted trypsin-like serine protease